MLIACKVWKVGNSLVITIPSTIAKAKGITEGKEIKINFNRIIVIEINE